MPERLSELVDQLGGPITATGLLVVLPGLVLAVVVGSWRHRNRYRAITRLPGWVGPTEGEAILPAGLGRLPFDDSGVEVLVHAGPDEAGPDDHGPDEAGPDLTQVGVAGAGTSLRPAAVVERRRYARSMATGPYGSSRAVVMEHVTEMVGRGRRKEHVWDAVHLVVAMQTPADLGEFRVTGSDDPGAPGEPIVPTRRGQTWRLRSRDPVSARAVLTAAIREAVAGTALGSEETVNHVVGHGWWAVERWGGHLTHVTRDLQMLAAVVAELDRT